MYTGRYYHKLDLKGRLSLPVTFRKSLGKQVVLTKGLDGCIFVFDEKEWEGKLAEAARLEYTKKAHRDFVRLLTNDAQDIQVDSAGRLLVPPHLRETARLQKDVVVVGSLDRVEIWDQAAYHKYLEAIEANAEAIAEGIDSKTV